MDDYIVEIKEIYSDIKDKIKSRLNEFRQIGRTGRDEDIFAELVFCLLTPQSKAKTCWTAVQTLVNKNLLLKGDESQIYTELKGVRFKYRKAEYVVIARKQFSGEGKISIKFQIGQFRDNFKMREWLVHNIKGVGYKEASHFLRNIGYGENLAILDRHILKNLVLFGVIKEFPNSLSKSKYLLIEKKMKEFAEAVNIPMSHLDFVLWCKETGEIFK